MAIDPVTVRFEGELYSDSSSQDQVAHGVRAAESFLTTEQVRFIGTSTEIVRKPNGKTARAEWSGMMADVMAGSVRLPHLEYWRKIAGVKPVAYDKNDPSDAIDWWHKHARIDLPTEPEWRALSPEGRRLVRERLLAWSAGVRLVYLEHEERLEQGMPPNQGLPSRASM